MHTHTYIHTYMRIHTHTLTCTHGEHKELPKTIDDTRSPPHNQEVACGVLARGKGEVAIASTSPPPVPTPHIFLSFASDRATTTELTANKEGDEEEAAHTHTQEMPPTQTNQMLLGEKSIIISLLFPIGLAYTSGHPQRPPVKQNYLYAAVEFHILTHSGKAIWQNK